MAAALGLAEIRRHGWTGEVAERLNCIQIVVCEAREVSHSVPFQKLV